MTLLLGNYRVLSQISSAHMIGKCGMLDQSKLGALAFLWWNSLLFNLAYRQVRTYGIPMLRGACRGKLNYRLVFIR